MFAYLLISYKIEAETALSQIMYVDNDRGCVLFVLSRANGSVEFNEAFHKAG